MTLILPTLPTNLEKASTHDLLTYLSTRLYQKREEEDPEEYEELLSDITTELLRRNDEAKED